MYKGSLLNNDSLNYDTNNSRSQSPANLRRELPSDLSEEALEREAGEFFNTFFSKKFVFCILFFTSLFLKKLNFEIFLDDTFFNF